MPQTKSAKKALRVSQRRTAVNSLIRQKIKQALGLARKKPSLENLKKVSSILDQAAKKGVIHQGKASRLKSRLSKFVQKSQNKRALPAKKSKLKIKKKV